MDRKNLFAFTFGVLMGSLLTMFYYEKKFQNFVEAEADWCEEVANEIKEEKPEVKEEIEEPKNVVIMKKDRFKKLTGIYSAEMGKISNPIEDREEYDRHEKLSNAPKNNDPYIISFEDFYEGANHHDKITITYYIGDDTLIDENEEIISDISGTVGNASLCAFGQLSEDPNIVYVRNEKMAIDYEVIRMESNYADVIGESRGM